MWRQTGENVTMTGGRQLSIGRRNTRIKCNAIPLAQQYKRISFLTHGHKMTVFNRPIYTCIHYELTLEKHKMQDTIFGMYQRETDADMTRGEAVAVSV